jgi:4-amino-4-deoxy-L-arabinose transferase-like glycosyltransferase
MKQTTVDAVYQDGVLKPVEPLDLVQDTRVRVTIEAVIEAEEASVVAAPGRVPAVSLGRLSAVLSLEWALFILALVVYGVTRLWALDQFPIYFFSDEAIQPVLAYDLLRRGLRDFEGTLLPTYFKNAQLWNLSLSVYIHAITVALFGKSIVVTRATSAVVSLFGAAAVGLILKFGFQSRIWWAGALLMAVTPAWFLHSRTAFETVMMVSFYAWFLLCYLLYRTRSPRFLYPSLVFGAAAFYAYAGGQAIVVATGALLLLSDLRYHLRNWRTALLGVLLLVVLILPYVRFQLQHPTEVGYHLRVLDSYWLKTIPIEEKLERFRQLYFYGLSPGYWFFPHVHDLPRHRMDGSGHIRVEVLPLVLVGLGVCLWRVRSSPHRLVLIAGLATPLGGAIVGVGITRVLSFVVPANLLAALGLDFILSWIRPRALQIIASLLIFGVLTTGALWMLRWSLVDGPLWWHDYGLGGMQWGAKQLFADAIPEYLARDPNTQLLVTPTWANGTDVYPRFFLSEEQRTRVQMLNVDYFMERKRDLDPNALFVMTGSEYQRALSSRKFKPIQVERVINYPDGSPGFYFAHLAYADNVDQVFAAEREARRWLVEGQVRIGDQMVRVRHSMLDAGQLKDMFDGDWFTLARGMEANPFVIELIFPQPRPVSGVAGDFGSMEFTWTVELYPTDAEEPISHTSTYRGLPPDPHVEVIFEGGPREVTKIRMEILNIHEGEIAKIHIRELALR